MRIKERFLSVTAQQMSAGSGTHMAGISTMTSGTAVLSVSAAGVSSGDIIIATPYMYANALTDVVSGSKGFIGNIAVSSVTNGAFLIHAIGSRAPIVDLPIAWMVMRK